jgi:ABC-type multidrug transport system ATPase subunit
MIHFERVTRRFGRRPGTVALHDVTLRIAPGEICGIAGPNGAGKSTLLGLALGFLRPTRGRVRLFEEAPRDFLRGAPAGYVPERVQLPARWRARTLLHGLAAVRARAGARERAERVLAALGLEADAERRLGELSRGTLQRVAIAQALLDDPPVLVLDEPTEGLDPLWRLRLRALLAERRAQGAVVLLASHDLAELERSADRVVVLDRGAIRSELRPRAPSGAGRWRLRVRAGAAQLATVFGDAQEVAEGEYDIAARDAGELSERLRAWLDLGGVLESVREPGLEDQLRDTLAGQR